MRTRNSRRGIFTRNLGDTFFERYEKGLFGAEKMYADVKSLFVEKGWLEV